MELTSGTPIPRATASSVMASMTVSMASSKTAAVAAATVSSSMGKMEGMDMGGDDCKISVSRAFLQNSWYSSFSSC
jgi:hypothetical protein